MNYNIVILSQPRTGSTLVCDLFNNFVGMKVLQEFFNISDITASEYLNRPQRELFLKAFKADNFSILRDRMKEQPLLVIRLLNSIFLTHRILKFHAHEINVLNLEFLFDDLNTKFILLTRRDKLSQYVSGELARVSKNYSSHNADPAVYNSINLEIDPIKLADFKEASDRNYSVCKEKLSGHNFLELVYEDDLVDDLESTIVKIQNWLESNDIKVDRKPYDVTYQKQSTRSLEEIILNYKDIVKE